MKIALAFLVVATTLIWLAEYFDETVVEWREIQFCDQITSPDETRIDLVNCCDTKYSSYKNKVLCIRAVQSMYYVLDVNE